MQVARANYPDTIHIGDVTKVTRKMWREDWLEDNPIDLIMGGSPCQGFSWAGKRLNFDDPRSKLFFEFVRLLDEFKPKYFLLENVNMKKEFQAVITEHLGVEPIRINSNLVSAQNRDRLYWTNIPVDGLPEDKGIKLKDILEQPQDIGEEHFHSSKAIEYMERGNEKWGQAGSRRADGYEKTPEDEKSFTLTANMHKGVPYNYFKDTRFKGGELREVFPDAEATDAGLILAGQADLKGHDYNRRVYDPAGKSPTLAAASGGNLEPKILQVARGKNLGGIKAENGKTPTLTANAWEQNNVVVYPASIVGRRLDDDGKRKDSDKTIPITQCLEVHEKDKSRCLSTVEKDTLLSPLPEGRYPDAYNEEMRLLWRKLTPLECERLQTVPDGYTAHVSNTQRYKMLGNGWTVDVICHLLKGAR